MPDVKMAAAKPRRWRNFQVGGFRFSGDGRRWRRLPLLHRQLGEGASCGMVVGATLDEQYNGDEFSKMAGDFVGERKRT
ncbi:hypothetical protein PanWU01x14_036830 [Parasponia andersonii]|uniref:Uncharacterized protein n=1 Tax=Parasponia andersonii TaxID=3476 RepID=A0A2P5DSJ5_PARAD|nr:hypothetical protein PanWU01x14_036830 [Parasponia andersonii]